jgi:hypothetical protein
MQEMQCPNCDTVLPADSGLCPSCGWVVESDPTVAYVPIQPNQPALTRDEAAAVEGIVGWALVVEKGPQAGMTFLLHEGITTVGRHPESNIFLDDITVSRHHCRFMCEEGALLIEDSGSTNGTYVNGARIDKGRLEAGDEVLIGRFHLIVAHGDV